MKLYYFKKVPERRYRYVHINDEDLIGFLDRELKKINPKLSPRTTLSELAKIDQWKNKLQKDAYDKLKVAPSRKASIRRQIVSIESHLEYDEKLDTNDNPNASYGL